MAVYKVIQDIEAEDKIVGFLTLKTFIYAIIAITLAYINFRLLIATGVGPLRFVFILAFLAPMLLFGVLAAPLGRDQPTEVWLLSHVQFFLKSRKRVWNQGGEQELVTITAPKKQERHLTKDLSQSEVDSRLKALATTLDSRGWAVKNVAVNLDTQPGYFSSESDRLVSAESLQQDQAAVDIHAQDDILDEKNNATAQHFDSLIQKAGAARKKSVKSILQAARNGEDNSQDEPIDYAFLDRVPAAIDDTGNTTFIGRKIVAPGAHKDAKSSNNQLGQAEQDFLERLHEKDEQVKKGHAGFKTKSQPHRHKKTAPKKTASKPKEDTGVVTAPDQAAKLELAQSGNDLKVATIAHLANRDTRVEQTGPNEVTISLH